uniref:Uncharacterized protein n=1 Tax=Ciona savignyi TaxID=51511 RepID=H2YV89_CIOSA
SELPCFPKRRAEPTCTDDDSVEENSPLGRRARSVRRPYNQHHRSRSSSCQRRSEFTDEDDDDLTDNRQQLSEEQFLLSRSTRSTSSGNFEPSRNLRSPLSSPDFTSMETNLDSYPANDSLRPFYTTSHRHLYPQ